MGKRGYPLPHGTLCGFDSEAERDPYLTHHLALHLTRRASLRLPYVEPRLHLGSGVSEITGWRPWIGGFWGSVVVDRVFLDI